MDKLKGMVLHACTELDNSTHDNVPINKILAKCTEPANWPTSIALKRAARRLGLSENMEIDT